MATVNRQMPVCLGYDIGELVICPFSFATNGALDPAAASNKGDILSSVVHTATGKYTCTISAIGFEIVAVTADSQNVGDATDMSCQVGVITRNSDGTGTIVVKTKAGATNTDFAADANTRVNVVVYLLRKSVKRHRS